MKKKLIKICAIVTLLLIVSSTAKAVPTLSGQETDTITWPYETWKYNSDSPFSWTHTWSFVETPTSITSATLVIEAFDVWQENFLITLDSISLDYLTEGATTNLATTTTFNLGDYTGALGELTDESATVSIDIPSGKSLRIDTSTITINYEYDDPDWVPPPPPPPPPPPGWIPAPGAILLGSIGVGLVGWLRRRRTL